MEDEPEPEPEGQQALSPEAEFGRYLSLKVHRDVDKKTGRKIPIDPLRWWRDRRQDFPLLSQMAIDVLSVPAMSAECERVFSQGKLTITSQRHGMKGATLDVLLCLKDLEVLYYRINRVLVREGTLAIS